MPSQPAAKKPKPIPDAWERPENIQAAAAVLPSGFASPRVLATLEGRRLRLEPEKHTTVYVVWRAGGSEPFAVAADEAAARALAAGAAKPGRAICLFRAALVSTYAAAAPEIVRTDHTANGSTRRARS